MRLFPPEIKNSSLRDPNLGLHDGLLQLGRDPEPRARRFRQGVLVVREILILSVAYSSNCCHLYSAGKSKTVTIPVLSEQLAVWTAKQTWVVEPGQFLVKIGTSDETFISTNITVKA